MERLGFSEDDFLSHAYAKQEVWDVSDVGKPSDFARINRLTQAAIPDECGDNGLSCATPDIQKTSSKNPSNKDYRLFTWSDSARF
ncbi:hypothetical protein Ae201684P_001026 [Aphanomyces euteiches]|nr:hypothetical protein Ae201684P_001026 [Aphanomyces euteiches]